MQTFHREELRPRATASFLWEDAESGDRLHVSIEVRDHGSAAFFADLEADGFRRIRESEVPGSQLPGSECSGSEMSAKHARRSGQAEVREGEDGGTLPCSVDITSAFHAPESEYQLTNRAASDEQPGSVGCASA